MGKIKKLIVLSFVFVFLCAFIGLGFSAVIEPEDLPLIYVSEEVRVQSVSSELYTDDYSVRFIGNLINNSEEDLENVTIKIYLDNEQTLQKLPITIELDKFLSGQEYTLKTYTYKYSNTPESVNKISFSVDDSEEVYINNPETLTDLTDIIVCFALAAVCLVAFVTILFTKSKELPDVDYVEDIDVDDDYDDDDNDKRKNAELAEKELEVEKLKLEVEKQKLENSKLQQNDALKTCPYCGTISKAKSLKCPNCGAHLKH